MAAGPGIAGRPFRLHAAFHRTACHAAAARSRPRLFFGLVERAGFAAARGARRPSSGDQGRATAIRSGRRCHAACRAAGRGAIFLAGRGDRCRAGPNFARGAFAAQPLLPLSRGHAHRSRSMERRPRQDAGFRDFGVARSAALRPCRSRFRRPVGSDGRPRHGLAA